MSFGFSGFCTSIHLISLCSTSSCRLCSRLGAYDQHSLGYSAQDCLGHLLHLAQSMVPELAAVWHTLWLLSFPAGLVVWLHSKCFLVIHCLNYRGVTSASSFAGLDSVSTLSSGFSGFGSPCNSHSGSFQHSGRRSFISSPIAME